mgnify:CR=1 FL=1
MIKDSTKYRKAICVKCGGEYGYKVGYERSDGVCDKCFDRERQESSNKWRQLMEQTFSLGEIQVIALGHIKGLWGDKTEMTPGERELCQRWDMLWEQFKGRR